MSEVTSIKKSHRRHKKPTAIQKMAVQKINVLDKPFQLDLDKLEVMGSDIAVSNASLASIGKLCESSEFKYLSQMGDINDETYIKAVIMHIQLYMSICKSMPTLTSNQKLAIVMSIMSDSKLRHQLIMNQMVSSKHSMISITQ